MVIALKTLETILPAMIAGAVLLVAGPAFSENLRFRCTNAASGTSWPIAVDVDHRRVDNLPAEIDTHSISWHDAENRVYDLDRTTGMLRMHNASSTGGYFLYYTCRPE